MSRLGSSFKRWISIAVMVGLIVTSLPVSAMAETTTDSGSVAVTDISGTNGVIDDSDGSTSPGDDVKVEDKKLEEESSQEDKKKEDEEQTLPEDDSTGNSDNNDKTTIISNSLQPDGNNNEGQSDGNGGDLPALQSNGGAQNYVDKELELEADHVLYTSNDEITDTNSVPITASGSSKVYMVFKRKSESPDDPFNMLLTLGDITSVKLEFNTSDENESAFSFRVFPLNVGSEDSSNIFEGVGAVAHINSEMNTNVICAQSNGVDTDGISYSIDVLGDIARVRASNEILSNINNAGYYGYAISLDGDRTGILCGEESKPKLVIKYKVLEDKEPTPEAIAAADKMLAARQSIQDTLKGSGTVSDPYLIYDAYDLCGMTENDNSCYKLMNDIDLKGIDWRPPGYYYWYPFMGYLDGNGYTIKNLHVGGASSDAWDINAGGLFGYLEGRVENLHVETVKAKRKGIDFFGYAGGIAGIANAPAEIINCSVNGYISGNNAAGGLVGIAYPGVIIESCCAIGSVDMSDAYAYINDNGSKLTKEVWDVSMNILTYVIGCLSIKDEVVLKQAQGKSKTRAIVEVAYDKIIGFPLDDFINTGIQQGLRKCSIGGLVGMNFGEIYNSYASVDLYNPQNQMTGGFDWDGDGEVNGVSDFFLSNRLAKTGGVVGRQIDGYGGTVNCFYNKERYNNVNNSNQGTGKTTAELKDRNLFANRSLFVNGTTIYGVSAESQWDYSVKLKSTGGLPLPKCNYVSRAKRVDYEPDIYYDSRVLMKTRENFIIGADVIEYNKKQYIEKEDGKYYEINDGKASSLVPDTIADKIENEGKATGAIYCTYCDELDENSNQVAVTGRFQRGSDARPYHVHDLASLLAMQDSKESHFILCTDIDFKVSNGNKTIQKYWWPAGKTHFSPIKGSLKGNVCYQGNDSTIYGNIKPRTVTHPLKRFTIKNLTVQHNRFVGLFASFRGTFSDINIQLAGGISGDWRDGIRFNSNAPYYPATYQIAGLFAIGKNGAVGAVAGETVNGALIRNCIVTGPKNANGVYQKGRIKGGIRSGGITGMNNRGSKIEGCEVLVHIDAENYETDYKTDEFGSFMDFGKAVVAQGDQYLRWFADNLDSYKNQNFSKLDFTRSVMNLFSSFYDGPVALYLRERYKDVCIGGIIGENFGTLGSGCKYYTQSELDSGSWFRGWSYHCGNLIRGYAVGRNNFESAKEKVSKEKFPAPAVISSYSRGSSLLPENISWTLVGAGSEEEPMVVRTEDDLKQLAEMIQQNGLQGTCVKQSKDIVLSDGSDFKGFAGTFKGVYDGNGCTISGIASDKPLFEKLEGAVIKNLGIKNSIFSGKAAFAEEVKDSVIQNCWIERTVTIGSETGNYASGFADILDDSSVFNVYNYGKLRAKQGTCGIAREMKGSSYVASCLVDMQKLSTTCWDYSLAYKVGEDSEFVNCLWVPSSTMRKTGDDKRSQEEQNKDDGCRALTASEASDDFVFVLLNTLDDNADEAQTVLNDEAYETQELSFADDAFWTIGDVDDDNIMMRPALGFYTMKYEGNGTETYPYLIEDSEDFDYFARKLAAGDEMEDLYFKQTTDIRVSETASQDLEEASETKFKGNYDGDYHTLSCIVINNSKENDGTTNAALFGAAEGATVKNLGIIDSSFSAATAAPFIAKGQSRLVFDEEANSSQKDVLIQNCWTGGDVEVTGTINAGGIVGSVASTQIFHCASYGTVDGTNCGGIAALMSKGKIAGCISGGRIQGNANYRFANLIQSTCKDSFFVNATGSGEDNISPANLCSSEFVEKLNSIAAAEENTTGLGTWAIVAEGENPIPTAIPVVNSASGIEDEEEEDVVPTTQIMGTSSVPVSRAISDSTPIAGDHEDFSGGNGTANAPYEIKTIEELDRVKHYLKSGYHFILKADLSFKNYKGDWVAIGTDPDYFVFQGVFDGNGHKISDLEMKSSASAGLFGFCAGTIKNLKVEGFKINTTGQAAGAIAAELCAGGRVEQCAVIDSIVESAHYSGGVVANAHKGSVINNVYADNVTCKLTNILILNSGEDGLLGGSREPSSVNGGFTDGLSAVDLCLDLFSNVAQLFNLSPSGLSNLLQQLKNGNSGARTAAAGGIVGFLGGSLSNSWVHRNNEWTSSLSGAFGGLFSAYEGEIVGREFYGNISGKNYCIDNSALVPVGSGLEGIDKDTIIEIEREQLINSEVTSINDRWVALGLAQTYELKIFLPSTQKDENTLAQLASLDHEIIATVPKIDSADGYYMVTTVNELAYIEFEGWSNYKLMKDIDLTGYNWVPLCRERDQYFDGTFDGQGHTIYGLHVETDENGGLFGFVLGTVKDLNIGVDVVDAYACAGGLAAGVFYRGQISRVSVVDNDIAIAMAAERVMQSGDYNSKDNKTTIESCAKMLKTYGIDTITADTLKDFYKLRNATTNSKGEECHYAGKTHIIGGGNEDGAGVGGLVGVVGKDVVIKDCYTRVNVSNANFVLVKEMDIMGIWLEIITRFVDTFSDLFNVGVNTWMNRNESFYWLPDYEKAYEAFYAAEQYYSDKAKTAHEKLEKLEQEAKDKKNERDKKLNQLNTEKANEQKASENLGVKEKELREAEQRKGSYVRERDNPVTTPERREELNGKIRDCDSEIKTKTEEVDKAKKESDNAKARKQKAQTEYSSSVRDLNKVVVDHRTVKDEERKNSDSAEEAKKQKNKASDECDKEISDSKSSVNGILWTTAVMKAAQVFGNAFFDIQLAFFDSCVGGLAGDCRGQLVNCYTIGSVCSDFSDAKSSTWQNIAKIGGGVHSGRLVGRVRTGQSVSKTGKIVSANQLVVNCYYYGGSMNGNNVEAEGYGTPCLKSTDWEATGVNKHGFDMTNPMTYTGFDFSSVWKVRNWNTADADEEYSGYPELVTRFDKNFQWSAFANQRKTFAGGDGSEENPFIIKTKEQFLDISELRKLEYYYKLEADLDLTRSIDRSTSFFGGVGYGVRGNGIDSDFDGDAFAGHFDGNGHKITFVEKKAKDGETGYFYAGGLFPVISGSVKNLEIECSSGGSKSRYHGLLAGRLLSGAMVENVSVTSDETGEILGGVTSGGIIGCIENGAILRNCSFYAPNLWFSPNDDSGIFVGQNKGTAEYIIGVGNTNNNAHIRDDGGNHKCVYALNKDTNYSETGLAGFDFNHIWAIDRVTRKPVLRCLRSTTEFDYGNELIANAREHVNGACITGRGTVEDPYMIRSAADFNALLYAAKNVNECGQTFSGVYFQQAADIELERGSDIRVPDFGGNYNGAGYKITIKDDYDYPIFTSMNGAVFRNCIFESKKLDEQTGTAINEPFAIAYGANNCMFLNCKFEENVGIVKEDNYIVNVSAINCICSVQDYIPTDGTFNGSIVGLEDADESVIVNNYDINSVDYNELNNMTGVPKELKNQIYPWQNDNGVWHMASPDIVYFDLGPGIHIKGATVLTYDGDILKSESTLHGSAFIKKGSEIVGIRAPQGTDLKLEVSYEGDAKTADYVMVTTDEAKEKPNLVDLILGLTAKPSLSEVEPTDYQSIIGSIGTLAADTQFIGYTMETGNKTVSLYKQGEQYKAVPVLSGQIQGSDIEKVRFYYTDRIYEEIEAGNLKIENFKKESTDLQNVKITRYFDSTIGPDNNKEYISKTFDAKIKLYPAVGWFSAETMEILSGPDKLCYMPGEQIDLSGAKIVLNGGKPDETIKSIEELFCEDGDGQLSQYYQNENGESDGIHTIVLSTPSSYTYDDLGNQRVVFAIRGYGLDFDIEIVKYIPVNSIRIIQPPAQTSIIEGGELSLAGGLLEVTYNSGYKTTVAMDGLDGVNCLISEPDESGTVTVTVQYEGCSDSFKVDYVSSAISSIEMYRCGKTNYHEGEAFSPNYFEVLIKYNNGTSLIKSLTQITGYGGQVICDTTTPLALGKDSETRTGRIKYQGFETTFEFTVIRDDVEKVEVYREPQGPFYKGKSLDVRGGQLKVTYKDGYVKYVDMDSKNVGLSISKLEKLGNQRVDVSYKENSSIKETSFTITVVSGVESIAINTAPTRTIYPLGVYDQLIPDGGTITVNYKAGYKQNITSEVIPLSKAEITGFNGNTVGTKTVQVSYEGATTSFDVNIYNFDILSVQPSAGNIVAGTLIPALKNGGSFVIKYTNNSTETVNMEDNDKVTIEATGVRPYNPFNIGLEDLCDKTFTLHYGSKTKSFTKLVQAYSISTVNTPSVIVQDKTGAPLSSTDWGDINAYGLNGLIGQTDITADMLSNLEVGNNKSITVSYGGATAQFTADVKKINTITLPQNLETEHQLGETVKRNETANQITVTYTDNTTATIPMTDNAVTISMGNGCLDGNGLLQRLGSQQVTVSYGGASANYNINVKAQRIEIVQSPKTKYLSGDRLSIEGGKIKVYGVNDTVFGTFDLNAVSVLGSAVTFKKGNDVLTTESKLDTNSGDSTTETQIDVYCGGVSTYYDVTILNSKQSVGASQKGFVRLGRRNEANGPTKPDKEEDPVLLVKNNGSGAGGFNTRKAYIQFDLSGVKQLAASNGLEIQSAKVTFRAKNSDGLAMETKISIAKGTWPTWPEKLTWNTADKYLPAKDNVFVETVWTEEDKDKTFEVYIPLGQFDDKLTLCFEGVSKNNGDAQYIYCDNNLKCEVTYKQAKDVKSITDITGFKNKYMKGGSLDTSQGSFRVTYTDESQETIRLCDLDASAFEYDFSTLGSQKTVTINYKGKSASFDVAVVEYGISRITKLVETDFLLGQPIEDEYIEVKYNDDTVGTVQISEGVTVSGYNADTPGTQTVQLSYGGRLKYVDVTVMAAGLTLVDQPTKTSYYKGEQLDLTGGKIRATGFESYSQEISLPDSTATGLTTVTGNTNTVGTREITVSYGGKSVKFNISVVAPWVTEITDISSETFILGESRESTRKTITVKKINGSESRIQLKDNGDVSVSDVNSNDEWNVNTSVDNSITSSLGEKQIKVTYSGKEKVFTVNVKASSISVTAPNKVKYLKGTDLDLTGGQITANGVNGLSKTVNMTSAMVSGYDKDATGTQTVTVTYGGRSTSFEVEVVENGISEITGLSRTEFLLGQPMSNEHINVKYNDGSVGTVQISGGVTVSGYNADMPGTQTVQLSYGGKQKSVQITVDLAGLQWVSKPTKTGSYYKGEALDLTGGVIKATGFGSGSNIYSKVISLTDPMMAGLITVTGNTNTVGTREITVSYGGKSVKFNINVVAPWVTEITKISSVDFTLGESRTGTSKTITVKKIDGSESVIQLKNNQNVSVTSVNNNDKWNVNTDVGSSITSSVGEKQIKVTYSGIEKVFTVNVNASSISVTAPKKVKYIKGTDLDLSGGKVTAYGINSVIKTVDMTSDMVSGYRSDSVGTQTLTVTYGGKTNTFSVEVVGNGISEITGLSRTEFLLGQPMSNEHINVKYNDGSVGTVQISEGVTVSGYNADMPGAQTVQLSYGGKQKSLDVTVGLAGLVWVSKPTKTGSYYKGEALDLTGGVIKATGFGSGSNIYSKVISLTDPMMAGLITVTGNTNTVGTRGITVSYGGKSVKFNINVVEPWVTEITDITTKSFTLGESRSSTKKKIYIKRIDGSTSNISLSNNQDISVTDVNSNDEWNVDTSVDNSITSSVGEKQIKVTYSRAEIVFTVNVNASSISVTAPNKTEYVLGEDLDLSGGKVTAYGINGVIKTVDMTPDMVSGYKKNSVGTQTLTVTYGGKTKTFNVTVAELQVTGISINKKPTKLSYVKGQDLDLNGGEITVSYNDGSSQTKLMSDNGVTVNGYEKNSVGTQTVTVKYGTFSKYFDVTVAELQATGIRINKKPTKLSYVKGQDLDLSGGEITVSYNDGSTHTMSMSDGGVTVSDYNKDTVGAQRLTVTYGTFSKYFNVTVVAVQITGISIKEKPTKLSYVKGQDLDLSGGEITVSCNDGSTHTMSMSAGGVKVMYYNKDSVGTQTLTVTYGGWGANFNVTVAELQATGVSINKKPTKLSYVKGQDLDLSGGEITISYNDGSSQTKLMSDSGVTVSGYEKNSVGTQTLTVTYGEKTNTFSVEVVENGISEITGLSRTEFLLGQPMSNEHINVKYNDGSVGTVQISEGVTVSGYNADMPGTQTVQLSYGGKQKSVDVTVGLAGLVWISKPTKTGSYYKGEALDLTGGVIKATGFGSGSNIYSKEISLTDPMMAGFITVTGNTNTVGTREITVSYGGKSVKFNINVVEPWVTEILDISSIYFTLGESRTSTSKTIAVKKIDGCISFISLSNNQDVSVTDVNSNDEWNDNTAVGSSITSTVGQKRIKVTYSGKTKEFTVNVNASRISVEEPEKIQYARGDALDLTGGQITAYGENNVTQKVPMEIKHISGYDRYDLGSQQLTVTFGEQTTTFFVTVVKKVTGIEITPPTRTFYTKGEELSLTGGKVRAVYDDSSKSPYVAMIPEQVSGYDKNKLGPQTVTVIYEEKSKTFNVEVIDAGTITLTNPQAAFVNSGGSKQTPTGSTAKLYVKNNGPNNKYTREAFLTFDLRRLKKILNDTGLEIKTARLKYKANLSNANAQHRLYLKGANEKASWNKWSNRPAMQNNAIASQLIKGTTMVSLNQTVTNYLKGKLNGNSATFGLCTEQYRTGEWFNIPLGSSMPTLVVETTKDQLTVKSIQLIQKPSKLKYAKGERDTLSLVGGQIKVTYSDNSVKEMPLNSEGITISGYNSQQVGSQNITISYGNKQLANAFTITVIDEIVVSKIRMNGSAEFTVKAGKAIDFTGRTMKVTYSDGSYQDIYIATDSAVTKPEPHTTKGDYIDIIQYGGGFVRIRVKVV